jgi:hypothetical protein
LIAAVLAYLGRTDAQLNQPEVKTATQFFAFEL